MFKLLKWIVAGGLLVAVASVAVFGTHALSYVRTAAHSIREGVHDQIPVEFELRRAAQLIREIEPQIHTAKRDVAQAEVDLERVEDEVRRLEERVSIDERRLENASSAMSAEAQTASLSEGVIRQRRREEYRLKHVLETHKNNVALLEGKRALIERQQKAVFAAGERLDAVRAEKARLEELISQLKTQKRQLDALAASRQSQDLTLDDTALGRARDVLERVKNRLDVAQKMLEGELSFPTESDEIVQVSPGEDVVGEVQAFLAERRRSGRPEALRVR